MVLVISLNKCYNKFGDSMKYVILNDIKYELIEDFKDAFNTDEVVSKATDYFNEYDYILGDWSYGKLRLKGFCKKENKLFKPLNDFSKKEEYIKNNCAYGCRYFVLEKISD